MRRKVVDSSDPLYRCCISKPRQNDTEGSTVGRSSDGISMFFSTLAIVHHRPTGKIKDVQKVERAKKANFYLPSWFAFGFSCPDRLPARLPMCVCVASLTYFPFFLELGNASRKLLVSAIIPLDSLGGSGRKSEKFYPKRTVGMGCKRFGAFREVMGKSFTFSPTLTSRTPTNLCQVECL